RSIGLIKTAPLLTQFANVELGEARERLPAGIVLPGDYSGHGLAISTRASRYTDWPFSALLRVTSRPAWRKPVMAARTVCGSQPSRWPISATDAPSGRSSMPISIARLVLAGGRSAPGTLAVPKSPASNTGPGRAPACSTASEAFLTPLPRLELASGSPAAASVWAAADPD